MDRHVEAALSRAGVRAEVLSDWRARRETRTGGEAFAATTLGERDVLMEGPIVDSETYEILRSWGYEAMVSPEGVRSRLAELGDGPVVLRIDSPGGDVFAAGNIVATLAGRETTAVVMGMAASAAGYIAISADETRMGGPLSSIMLHRAWSVVIGNANDLRSQADLLDKLDAAQTSALAAASDLDEEAALAAIDAETWWVGQEAIDAGLASGYEMGGDHDKDKREGAIERSPEMQRRAIAMIRGSLV